MITPVNPAGKVLPILFSGPMVRALLDGRKTQTRRVMKPGPPPCQDGVTPYLNGLWRYKGVVYEDGVGETCPFGKPGDLLYVRETCRASELPDGRDGVFFNADDKFIQIKDTSKAADEWSELFGYRHERGATVPSIHMPRWASRLTLRITDVRVERLQDISEADAAAEGCTGDCHIGYLPAYQEGPHSYEFAQLWESINGSGAWDANPWVWVVYFEVIRANVDDVLGRN